MGFLHRQLACLRLRGRSTCPSWCHNRYPADVLVHRWYHRGCRHIRLPDPRRPVGLESPSCPAMDFPSMLPLYEKLDPRRVLIHI